MICEKIDLYEYFKVERKGATGGYLTVYARTESKELKKRMRSAMLVIPGGGYWFLSDREGEPIALKYLDNGFCAFVLSYSLKTAYPTPLIEAMLAVKYIRENAVKYSLDKDKICAIGFSAGGHLAGLLATVKKSEAEFIGCRAEQVKLNAVVLSYPVVTMGEFTHCDTRQNITGGNNSLFDGLSVEKRIDNNTAPAFIWHTFEDDCVPMENSLMLANAYRRAKIPFALSIFEHGWHGLCLADEETNDFNSEQRLLSDVGKWYFISLDWLKARGFAPRISI